MPPISPLEHKTGKNKQSIKGHFTRVSSMGHVKLSTLGVYWRHNPMDDDSSANHGRAGIKSPWANPGIHYANQSPDFSPRGCQTIQHVAGCTGSGTSEGGLKPLNLPLCSHPSDKVGPARISDLGEEMDYELEGKWYLQADEEKRRFPRQVKWSAWLFLPRPGLC